MKTFREFLKEKAGGGEAPGKLEVDSISLDTAKKYAEKKGVLKDLPEFEENFSKAQKKSIHGKTKRKDMPVINTKDVRLFQSELKKGKFDIKKPFSDETDVKNPFPEGLSGDEAKKFLERGLKDGNNKDDVVEVKEVKKVVGKLKPIQRQIYFDKSVDILSNFGVENTKKFLANDTFFITSSDDFIIDGHHRFLSGMLIDPSIKVKTISIELPIKELLPLSLSFGDSVGNKRNQ